MRILLLNYEYPPLGGGGGAAMQDLAEGLARRHEVMVLTSGTGALPPTEERRGVRIVRLHVPLRRHHAVASLTSMLAFAAAPTDKALKALGDFRPEVMNTWFALPSGPLGCRLAPRLGCPQLLTIVGGDIYDPSRPLSPHRWAVLRQMVRGAMRRADQVCAISTDVRDRAAHYYDPAVAGVPVIALGLPPLHYSPASRASLGLPEDAFVITSIGRLIKRKGMDRLILGLAAMGDPVMRLTLVGEGPQRDALERLAHEQGVGDQVHFWGHISDECKLQVLAASDAFALASLHEGFGLVYIEAMQCGLPVISNLDGGQRDFLQDGVNARVVADASPESYGRLFAEVKQDAALRDRLSAGARETAGGITIDRMVDAYEQLMEEMLQRQRQPTRQSRQLARGPAAQLPPEAAAAALPQTRPMRLLVLNYEYPPLGGGASPVTAALAAELAGRGHQLDVVTMAYQDLPAEETLEGVRIHRVPCTRKRIEVCTTPEMLTYLLPAWRKANELLQRQRYDLIHGHFIFPTGPVAVALARKHRLPLVISSHGSDIPGYNPHRFQVEHRLMRPVWRWLACQAGAIVPPSEVLAAMIARQAACVTRDGRLQVIPYGVRPMPFEPEAKVPGRVLMVGRLLERKGFRTMLRVLQACPLDLELHIVGDGPDMPVLQEMAQTVQTPVIFHGWLDNRGPEYAELYRTSSIFVFPSQMESFGMVLGEAMTAGQAIITSNVGACPEVVGDTGILIGPDDDAALAEHLAALLGDPERVRQMGLAAHERAIGRYTWQAAGDAYEKLFADLISGWQRRSAG
jgi:glycosyltransferase involved in cell wall biosynthesis